MQKLSTGQNSTLGVYKQLSEVLFGAGSKAVAYLTKQIAKAPNGEQEEVISDEGHMLNLLASIAFGEVDEKV